MSMPAAQPKARKIRPHWAGKPTDVPPTAAADDAKKSREAKTSAGFVKLDTAGGRLPTVAAVVPRPAARQTAGAVVLKRAAAPAARPSGATSNSGAKQVTTATASTTAATRRADSSDSDDDDDDDERRVNDSSTHAKPSAAAPVVKARAASPSSSEEDESEIERRRARALERQRQQRAGGAGDAASRATAAVVKKATPAKNDVGDGDDNASDVEDDPRAIAQLLANASRNSAVDNKPAARRGASDNESDENDDDDDDDRHRHRHDGNDKRAAAPPAVVKRSDDNDNQSDNESSGSYEYETESDELNDVARVAAFRPMFVSKAARSATAATATTTTTTTTTTTDQTGDDDGELDPLAAAARDGDSNAKHELELRKLRREAAKQQLIADLETEQRLIARDSLAKTRADDDELDRDAINAEEAAAEYAAWRLRELARVKRDMIERQKEKENNAELERRRHMTDEEIAAEDAELLAAQKNRTKPKMRFMAKYYHEGAFFRGGDDGDILEGRDFLAPTEADAIDKTALPKIMQVRRGFGLKKQTRYTHLADQDTTDKNALWFQNSDLAKSYKSKMSGSGTADDRATKRARH